MRLWGGSHNKQGTTAGTVIVWAPVQEIVMLAIKCRFTKEQWPTVVLWNQCSVATLCMPKIINPFMWVKICVCLCICVWVHERVCVYVSVCVYTTMRADKVRRWSGITDTLTQILQYYWISFLAVTDWSPFRPVHTTREQIECLKTKLECILPIYPVGLNIHKLPSWTGYI